MPDYTYEQAVAAGKQAVAAGDTEAANEIATYIDVNKLQPTVGGDIATPIADTLERVEPAIQDFNQKGVATTDRFKERLAGGLYGPSGIGVSDTAHVVGAGIEYAAGRGMDALTSFTPQEIQDEIGEYVTKGLTAGAEVVTEFLQNNPKAMEGVKLLKEGYGAVDTWLTQNPGIAGDFLTMFDVASVAMPAAKVGPIADPTLGRAGQKLQRWGTKQSIEESREGVRELIYPDSRYGAGDTDEAGVLNTRTYEGSPREQEISESLLLTDKIKPNRSYGYNQARAYEAVTEQRKEMTRTIMKAGNPSVDKDKLAENLANALEDLGNTPGTEMLVGDTKVMAENLLSTAIKLLEGSNGRAMDVLKARREFDKIVRKAKGDQFNPERTSAASEVNRIVRDALNESVRDAVGPEHGDDVYHFLRQQHNLLEGADILYDNMKKEELNAIKRIWANVSRVGHLPKTPLALGATAAVAAPFIPAVSGVAAVGLGLYGAKKAATSATSKKALGELLTNINKAIKTTENSAMLSTLKADRLLVIEMLKGNQSEDERAPLKSAGNE